MSTNFSYLKDSRDFALFASSCIDAENVLSTSPVLSAVASRKALELCVKWIYSTDNTLRRPREDGGVFSILYPMEINRYILPELFPEKRQFFL